MEFNWDDGNWFKCTARTPQEEIEGFLIHPATRIWPDPSEKETRYRAAGYSSDNRPMFAVFTFRRVEGEIHVRPISARYAHKEEARTWPKRK